MEALLHLPMVPDVELVAAKAVETLGKALGMDQTRVEAASVAVVEACLNAMEHGGGRMVVRLKGDPGEDRPQLRVEVEDNGKGFDPESCPNNSNSRIHGCVDKRGWGLALIRELMDEVQIQSHPGQTLVLMSKYVEKTS